MIAYHVDRMRTLFEGKKINLVKKAPCEKSSFAGNDVYLGPEVFDAPKYHDGDIFLVSTKKYPEPGEIGIFTLDGCGYVKKLGDSELISLNAKYDPIPLDDSICCNGKVIGILDPEWIK